MTNYELTLKGKYNRDERRYDESYQFFLEAALQKEPVAMKNLGMAYMYGEGVRQDYKKGFHYLSLAYELSRDISLIGPVLAIHDQVVNDSEGKLLYRFFLDYLISEGEWKVYVIKANEFSKKGAYPYEIEKKIEYLEKALCKGINVAADCIGEMYFLGEEIKCDYRKAYEYFKRYKGFESFAKPFYMGRMYESGLCVRRDLQMACHEYERIVESNIPMRGSDVFYMKAAERLRYIRKMAGGNL